MVTVSESEVSVSESKVSLYLSPKAYVIFIDDSGMNVNLHNGRCQQQLT
jgi:hypothetical protein